MRVAEFSRRCGQAGLLTLLAAISRADPADVRLWRKSLKADNAARATFINAGLKAVDLRCDSLQSLVMRSPGTWVAKCAPAYRYLFTFDAAGRMKGVHVLRGEKR